MREIKLTQGKVAWVDDEDCERVNQFKWYAHKDCNTFYAVRNVRLNGKRATQLMHRFIMGDTNGDLGIDHKDGDGLHNWKLNLRPATRQENNMNARKRRNCSSEYIGVHLRKDMGKYAAYIQVNGIVKHLGCFDSEKDAACARDYMAKIHHGEFLKLNFP